MPHVIAWISFSATEEILGLQLSDKATMLVLNTIIFFRIYNLHEDGVVYCKTNMAAMTSRADQQ